MAGGLARGQQIELYQRISPVLFPRDKKKPRTNSSLLRELWRTAASMELLPLNTKTDLGDALMRMVMAGNFRESELWCLSRLGARELFYGPMNQVLPPGTAARWVEALLTVPSAGNTLASLARLTSDQARDLSPSTREMVRGKLEGATNSAKLLAMFDGEEARDEQALQRIFGEELPSGLVLTTP